MSLHIPALSRAGRVLVTAGAITALVFGTALSASADPQQPTNTVLPAITGTPNIGEELTASPGTWTNPDDSDYSVNFDWLENGESLQSGSSNTYDVRDTDFGQAITVEVTLSYGDDVWSDPATSAAVTIVTAITVVTAPVLTGTATTGSTLSVTPGVFGGPDTDVSYVWLWAASDDGGRIEDATGSTYVVTNDRIGETISVIVTARAIPRIEILAKSAVKRTGDFVSVRLDLTGAVIPAAPFATDAGLTSANEGGVTGSVTGTTATFTIPNFTPDSTLPFDQVFVYGYSTPTPLGFYSVVNGKIVVNFAALPAGAHKLLVIGPDGTVLGWFGVSVLAATGASVNPMEWYLAGGALIVGAVLVGFGVYSRRRRASL
jgi:hypothetical protein